MSFFFDELFGGGMPGGNFHSHHHGHGHNDSDEEPVDTEKFYKLLGIEKDATQDDIKKAYRKKARLLHPDRHPDEREKYQHLFQEVQSAHEVLKDPQKRKLYDKYGEEGAKRGGGGGRGGGSIFEQMFGGRQAANNDHGVKKSPVIKTTLDVTLEDIYRGSTKKMTINRRVAGNDNSKCARCKGQGQITQIQRMGPMVLQQRTQCNQCGGIGYKLERQSHEIEVHVPVGGRNGESITVQNQGNKYPDMEVGDVVIQLRQQKHEQYKRQGADLGTNYTLSLRQALCGYKIKLPHVSGKTLTITPHDPTEIVQPGSLKVVHTMGLPQRYSAHVKGHLYIVMEVEMPKPQMLSMDAIKQFAKLLPEQQIVEEDDGDEDVSVEEEKEMNSNNNNAKNNKNSQKKKGQNKGNSNKGNGNKNNGNKNGNNKKKNKKKKKQKGGMFSGLHGQFGGAQAKGNKNDGNEEEDDDELVEEVEAHTIDGNPKATPASASSYYQDEDDDNEQVQCRQM